MNQVDQLIENALRARREHRLTDAQNDLVAAVAICRETGASGDLARALTALGQIERDLDHFEAAGQYYEEASAILRLQGDPQKLAHALRHLGDIHRHAENLSSAGRCYADALELYRADAHTSQLDLANALRGFALLKEELGDAQDACRMWKEARDLYAAMKVDAGVAESARRLSALGCPAL